MVTDPARAHLCNQDESSEEFIGEWMEERKNRNQMVIATKVHMFTLGVVRPYLTMAPHRTVYVELQAGRPVS
jgi:hypothetical protein